MSLRDEAITHMEGQLRHYMEDELFLGLEEIIEYDWIAGASLDALLDFLDAHTEEWEAGYLIDPVAARVVDRLVAALRGTTEEGGT